MDSPLQLGNENLSEEIKRQVPGPFTQFQRNFIQTVTLLGKLPTRVLHCKKPHAAVALLRIDQEAMKSLTADDEEDFLLSKVDLRRQQISQTVEEVQKVIHQLTTEISCQDSRFQAVPYRDTYNGNIKVLAPGHFLITVPVRGLAGYREAKEQRWRYYSLKGSQLSCPLRAPEGLQQWLQVEQFMKNMWQWHEADVNIEGDVVPAKVLQVFRKLVEKAITACHLSGKVSLLTSSSGVWVAVETSVCPVEIELAPTVEIPSAWPKKAQWPRCMKRWPSPQRVECVKSFGFNLLARSNYHWQLSFSQAEQVLLQQLDEDGGCRRQCFWALRQLTEDVWCPGGRPAITAHHLQMVLFWTCEKYPHLKDWQDFESAFPRLVRKLHKCVSQRFLKHYFVPKSNLLQSANASELDSLGQKLAFFLKNPQISVP
ncbi:protein mab-21-like 3 [Heterocephalus glaber]|uniref:Protein mab-21-like 3 n=1 Tax=Heterocephalus glaber TaxID=10181 RepID=A0AAX6TM49_HETGA|nr:protein mab-21-like 3 [Heterocephalus glaber]XP_004853857.1 protein mab-21-like 3 [Heterocephalus glaber]XP_004853859.1 protein mab-21-like 3 [Heterocephalus glaber]XP_004853861.1 protein mab-21-like 3 [Heterocephalus glaber]XP_004853863.1 protein mab-21-like 3 [Heterocephalus glaber]XP_021121403.1 protein mab-21-like 3 [Heterocephalus glaber]XP_021121405.1 protein mab-21-like 3 [Heterocephalus glaber]